MPPPPWTKQTIVPVSLYGAGSLQLSKSRLQTVHDCECEDSRHLAANSRIVQTTGCGELQPPLMGPPTASQGSDCSILLCRPSKYLTLLYSVTSHLQVAVTTEEKQACEAPLLYQPWAGPARRANVHCARWPVWASTGLPH